MIDYDQIYKDTVAIVKSLVNGALAGGCNPKIDGLLSETYTALKGIAQQAIDDENNNMQPQSANNDDIDF